MAAAGIVFNTILVLTALVTVNPEDETLPAKGEFDTLTNDPDQVQCNLDDTGSSSRQIMQQRKRSALANT